MQIIFNAIWFLALLSIAFGNCAAHANESKRKNWKLPDPQTVVLEYTFGMPGDLRKFSSYLIEPKDHIVYIDWSPETGPSAWRVIQRGQSSIQLMFYRATGDIQDRALSPVSSHDFSPLIIELREVFSNSAASKWRFSAEYSFELEGSKEVCRFPISGELQISDINYSWAGKDYVSLNYKDSHLLWPASTNTQTNTYQGRTYTRYDAETKASSCSEVVLIKRSWVP